MNWDKPFLKRDVGVGVKNIFIFVEFPEETVE